jgi:putative thiamine transport system permease protein
MAGTLRRVRALAGAAPLLVLWALPLLASIAMLAPALADGEAWASLLAHPQLVPALALSLFTGGAAAVLALLLCLLLLAGLHGGGQGRRVWRLLEGASAAGLALPHLAFAIGFGFLVMPSGLLARLLVGGDAPPAWVSVQDPWGLSLTFALAIKEVPFLLTAAFAILARGDAAARLEAELRAAASLGHGRGSAWLRVLLPQLLHQLRWPLLIVFVYGATVVDMALVLGPSQPPTLAVVIWHALNDVNPVVNRMGLAGTLLLTLALALALGLAALLAAGLKAPLRRLSAAGPSPLAAPKAGAVIMGGLLLATLTASLLLLLVLSLAPRWPYPTVVPPVLDASAWHAMAASPQPLWLSLGLGLAAAAAAVAMAVLWFETQGPARDGVILGLAVLSLALPQLAVAGGQYRLFLDLGLAGTVGGLFLAHLAPVAAYVLIVLVGPWRTFDARFVAAARALSASPPRAFLRVKLPLLKAPLLSAAAIGFAVSVVQFVPAQLVAAGRFATLPMEAVTLSSGGSRPLMAAFALALAVPPLLAFLAAALLGRPRWR